MLYFVVVGHYRNGDFADCRAAIANCIEVGGEYRRALELIELVNDRENTGYIDVLLVAGALSLLTGIAVVSAFSFVPKSTMEALVSVPELSDAYSLKNKLEERLKNDGFMGLCISVGATGIIFSCFGAILAKKN